MSLTTAGIYYQNLLVWNDKLRTLAGLRTDFYKADVNSSNPINSGSRDAHITSPKLSIILGPWAKTEYYVNFGYGFHSNDARGTTLAVNPVPPLVRAKGEEVGLRSALAPDLQTALSLWRLDLDSELRFVADQGTTEPSRPSRRTGVEWANFWKASDWLTVDADFAVSRSRFADDNPVGNFIPDAIEKTTSIGVVGKVDPWSGAVRLRYFGPRPLIENNSVRSRSSTLINANVGYKIQKNAKVTLEVFNLANAKVNDIEYSYASRLSGEPLVCSSGSPPPCSKADPLRGTDDVHFPPAEPRSFRVSLSYRF